MKDVTLTPLEKGVLRDILSDGYAYDNPDDGFLTWGISGKQERGAAASLVKKGILFIQSSDGQVCCGKGYTVADIEQLSKE